MEFLYILFGMASIDFREQVLSGVYISLRENSHFRENELRRSIDIVIGDD